MADQEAPSPSDDPLAQAREARGTQTIEVNGRTIPLVLGHRAIRAAANDWRTFSSDAPFRVPVPSEEAVRSVRQLPIEADPPFHRQIRKLLEPIFLRPQSSDYAACIEALVQELLDQACKDGPHELVRDLALPIQSRALAMLLGMPQSEADIRISCGTRIFDDPFGDGGGATLETYLRAHLDRASKQPEGTDYFCELERVRLDERALTFEEKLGIANLTFAGGRDTVINAVTKIIAHFATDPASVREASQIERYTNLAVEEFVRFVSPLTLIGRVCLHATKLGTNHVEADSQIGLCWAAANIDPSVFEDPTKLDLTRSPNPHVGFGSGHHSCLGSQQARVILRSLVKALGRQIGSIEIIEADRNIEQHSSFERPLGYRRLVCAVREQEQ
ncbi:MAG: cytochrome P450 [Pseudomonadota bacterium]